MNNSVQVSGFFFLAVPGRRKRICAFFCSLFKISRQGQLPGQCPEAPMYLPKPLLTVTTVWSPITQGHGSSVVTPACLPFCVSMACPTGKPVF